MVAFPIEDDHREVRRDVSWEAFERFLDAKGDEGIPRVTYLDGVLELMTPSRGHERQAWSISLLLSVYAEERGIALTTYGGWTLKNKLRRAGCEPDGCWVIGDDPESRERPDLAIESQWSRSAIDKLEVYRRLDVREVWLARNDVVAIHVLSPAGFQEVTQSSCFPDLDVAKMCSYLDEPTTIAAMRAYRAFLNQ